PRPRNGHAQCIIAPGSPHAAQLERKMYWNLWLDIRHAARRLLGAPGFTGAAVLTIALSVGANAAIFGVAKSVLLDSLPYADAGSLVRIYGRLRDGSQDRGPLTAGTIA